jgi:hypothetical protein
VGQNYQFFSLLDFRVTDNHTAAQQVGQALFEVFVSKLNKQSHYFNKKYSIKHFLLGYGFRKKR